MPLTELNRLTRTGDSLSLPYGFQGLVTTQSRGGQGQNHTHKSQNETSPPTSHSQ